jgi:hypothetical protein
MEIGEIKGQMSLSGPAVDDPTRCAGVRLLGKPPEGGW